MENSKDRVSEYLVHHLDKMIFDEFSDEYLKKAEIADILKGVPVPFRAEDITGGSTSTLTIARNMAFVIGCDSEFKYKEQYLKYIRKFFPRDFDKALINEGIKAAEDKEPEIACVYFRAASQVDPESENAAFLYARACKDAYEEGDGEDYIGTFKAEALRMFERTTIDHPEFSEAYYFLGYAYLNLGLYTKAKLTFDEYLKLEKNGKYCDEVRKVEENLADPMEIERGMNAVISGRCDQGVTILEPYVKDARFNTYWPLWYYLGMAYRDQSDDEKSESMFLKGLSFSPSNTGIMNELIGIYEERGDEEKVKKYRDKIELVNKNSELDKEEKAGDLS